ncbi:MAG: CDP-alcohol phosphatidyltransferase family protein [Gemmatimonadota bacterium]|nr:CDP-alcohol phosphatidyltransferase family protein [Gemmatimonadota bacterium]
MSETIPPRAVEQQRLLAPADALTLLRVPLAGAFITAPDPAWRVVILCAAALSDLLDGKLARRLGPSRLGAFLDPVADKLFAASAFGVVLWSGALTALEIAGVLLRDIAATAAFVTVAVRRRPHAMAARHGGKLVTVLQLLTLFAFLAESPLLRPIAWATAVVSLYAIWDYQRVAATASRPVGS